MSLMAKKKEPEERVRSGKNLNVWINPELRDALDELRKDTRRSLTSEVELALEEYLEKHGKWPPSD